MNQFEYWLKLAERGGIGTEGFWQSYVDQIYAASMASVWTFAILGLITVLLLAVGGVLLYRYYDGNSEQQLTTVVCFSILIAIIIFVAGLIVRDGWIGAQSPEIRALQSLRMQLSN